MMGMLRTLAVICLALISFFPSPAKAADEDLVINVSEEYGGFYRPGEWYPVVVSISNKPAQGRVGDKSNDFVGRLIITSSSKETREGDYEFIRDVEVPAFSVQRFTLFVKLPDDPIGQPQLQVRTEGGRLLRRIELSGARPLEKEQILLVKVQKTSRRLSFPVPRSSNVNPITEAEIQPTNLPRHWAAYDPVDILVFPEWPEAQLSELETQAILDWVGMGGTLLFLGGANSNSYYAAGDNPLLPVAISSSNQHTLNTSLDRMIPAMEGSDMTKNDAFLLSSVDDVDSDAEVIWDAGVDDPTPVIVRKAHGRGQILFMGVDLESTNLKLSNALMPYWMAITPMPNITDWNYAYALHRKETKIVTKGAARAPHIVLIILICVLYTIVVGPMNFYLLGKYNRIQYAWFTVPAIVIFFSGLIYTFGTLTKGGKYIGREITLYMGVQDQPVVEERSLVSIFTPEADSFYVRPEIKNQTVADSDRWHDHEAFFGVTSIDDIAQGTTSAFGFKTANPVLRSNDDGIYIDNWPLKTFDASQFEVRGPRRLDGSLEAKLTYHNISTEQLWLQGSLENNTGLDFYETALFWGGRGLPLGKMDAGNKIELTREKTTRPFFAGEREKSAGGWQRISDAMTTITPTRNQDSDSDINRENARAIMRAIFRPKLTGSILPPLDGKLYFVGVAEDSDLSVQTNFEHNSGSRSIIVAIELNPIPAEGQFVVPQHMVQVRLHEYPGERMGFTFNPKQDIEDESLLEIANSYGILSVELPFHDPSINAFSIQSQFFTINNSTNQELLAGVYRFQTHQFVPFEANMLRDNPDQSIMTPYSGRAWVQFEAREKKSDSNTASVMSFGQFAQPMEIDDLYFQLGGTKTESQ